MRAIHELKGKFPSRIGKGRQSRRKKGKKRKVKRLKEKRMQLTQGILASHLKRVNWRGV